MEKLPPASYVRLVDIWLICGQLIPFMEVILLTLIELYNEEDEINHHGSVRNVCSTSKVSSQFLVNNKPASATFSRQSRGDKFDTKASFMELIWFGFEI